MQDSLFPESDDEPPRGSRTKPTPRAKVEAAAKDPHLQALADALPARLRLGTSSWTFPGWTGRVWARDYPEARLSKHGLAAYAQHPLLRTVSLDRAFYRPLDREQYAAYAAQVPDDFRFVIKAPSLVADAMMRNDSGRGMQSNPHFLDPELAQRAFAQPALDGLRHRLGALVFQLSPLPPTLLQDLPAVLRRIDALLGALPDLRASAPDAVVAVEVRNPEFLTPAFAEILRAHGASYCVGLHAKMPPIAEQLPMLRALWPGPLVCRWSLHRKHGAFGYEEAKRLYGRFDQLVDPDPDTRAALARVIVGTTRAGHPAYVTINNKAEGSAPMSAVALAESVRDRLGG